MEDEVITLSQKRRVKVGKVSFTEFQHCSKPASQFSLFPMLLSLVRSHRMLKNL